MARTSTIKSLRTSTSRASTRKERALSSLGITSSGIINSSKHLAPKTPKTKTPASASHAPSSEIILDDATRKALHRITTHPSLTPYRRLVYRTLLSVPHGRWTTYAVLSAHLTSSARAIGNAMRANPFAPEVPCHRVLATDRTIGGYKGAWGNGGSYAVEKTKLLREEGIVFDVKGRADGDVFRDFVDLGTIAEGKAEVI